MTPEAIAVLLQPYVSADQTDRDWPHIYAQLALYLELILKWNARTNLSAVRAPEEIVRRHFGESLFAGLHLPPFSTLLDFGSGAGFPGIPIQLLHPGTTVTLAESQGKKASFLREAVRTLKLPSEIWTSRVESMPEDRQFDIVTLRAVDDMDAAVAEAVHRTRHHVIMLTTTARSYPHLALHFHLSALPLPNSHDSILLTAHRI